MIYVNKYFSEFSIDKTEVTVIVFVCSQLERVIREQKNDRFAAAAAELRPYGQPGRMPKTAPLQLATLVALLIELEAQFYKLVTINQCPAA